MGKQVSEPIFLSINAPEWLDFIQSKQEATLFHHPAWINLLTNCYRFKAFSVILRDEQGKMTAGIPFIEIPGIFEKKWVSLPFSDHCAPLYQDPKALHELNSTLISLYANHKIPRLVLRWNYLQDPRVRVDSNYVLSQVKLSQNVEDVASRIKHKYFRKVKAAQERGVSTKMGIGLDQLSEFYELHLRSRHKHGVPVQPWIFFESLHDQLLEKGFGFLINAYKNKACIAAAVFLYWNKTIIYKYSAVNEEGRHALATDLILWDAICWACENGLEVLDMGRTDLSDSGLLEFKKRWGAEMTSLPYTYVPHKETWNKGIPIDSFLKSLIRRSPIWVCHLSGELFYRYFA
jgi:CelD/BcsL family acetyltransferase involved in cellulose biosynthesis